MQRVLVRSAIVAVLLCLYSTFALPAPEVLWRKAAPVSGLQISFSPDGHWMALSQFDPGKVLLYRLPERELVQVFDGYPGVFLGNHLLAISTGDGLHLRHIPTLRPVDTLQTSPRALVLDASLDGQALLVRKQSSFSIPSVELWTGTPLQRRMILYNVSSAAIAAGGNVFAYSYPNSEAPWRMRVIVRRVSNGLVVRQLDNLPAGTIALSPDGNLLAVSAEAPPAVEIYRVADGQLVRRLNALGNWKPYVLCFSPDGQYLAGGYGPYYEQGVWQIWRVSDGALLAGQQLSYSDEVWHLAFSPDSQQLYLVLPDGLRVVRLADMQVENWEAPKQVRLLSFVGTGEQVAVVDRDKLIFLHSANGEPLRTVALPPDLANYPYAHLAAAISADGQTFATYPYETGIGVFSLTGDTAQHLYTLPIVGAPPGGMDEPDDMKLNADGSLLYIHDISDSIHVVHTATGSVLARMPGGQFDISPDGTYVACITTDGVAVRQVQGSTVTDLYTLPLQASTVQIVANGTILAVHSGEELQIYSLQTGQLLQQTWLMDWLDAGTRAVFSEDARVAALFLEDRIEFISLGLTGQTLARWLGRYPSARLLFSPDRRYIAVSSNNRVLEMLGGFSGVSSLNVRIVPVGWMGLPLEHLRYQIRNPSDGSVLNEGTLVIRDGYSFIPLPDNALGTLLLTVEGAPFLKRSVSVTSSIVSISLLPGDIDGDNEVTLFDFGRLVAAFGSFAGEERYDIDADLDGDGEISLWDFGWLIEHFGLIGDE